MKSQPALGDMTNPNRHPTGVAAQDENGHRVGRKDRNAPVFMIAELHILVREEPVVINHVVEIHSPQRRKARRPVHDIFVQVPFESIGDHE